MISLAKTYQQEIGAYGESAGVPGHGAVVAAWVWWDVDAFGGVSSATCPNYISGARSSLTRSLHLVQTATTHHDALAQEDVIESLVVAGERCVFDFRRLPHRCLERFFDLPSRIPNMIQNKSV
jgi:hypothetical protein